MGFPLSTLACLLPLFSSCLGSSAGETSCVKLLTLPGDIISQLIKLDMNLKENKEGHMGALRERKGKGEMT